MVNPENTLVLGLNLAPYTAEMDRLRRLFLLAAPAALLLVALGGWWLAQRALRPVLALTAAAESITAQGLDRRIAPSGDAQEFDRLVRVFNGMLDRLETSFRQAVRFSADAAHELKTPLTILQGELAAAVQAAEPGSEHQQALGRLLEEVQRLKTITRKLLLLSLADSGQLKPQPEPVNLSEMVEAAGEDVQLLAGGLRVELSVEPALWVNGDPDLLRQVIQNLTSNSVKYNEPGGLVAIGLHRQGDNLLLAVANSGPGIPPEDRERVFERFYRGEKSRNRRVDGLGLGLSLAREIVRAHHGQLVLQPPQNAMTTFTVTFPAANIHG
jgi:heavy metal sensor kinase